jgi:hypothetical protein
MSEPLQGEFRPEVQSRRSEAFTWGLAALVWTAGGFLLLRRLPVPTAVPFLAAFLTALAASLSLGNWSDRRACLRLGPDAVYFENGLRRVAFTWAEIERIQVFPSRWGQKVRVIGSNRQFEFRTLGEISLQGEVQGKMGFAAGEAILSHLLARAGLTAKVPLAGGYTYSRP